MKITGIGADIIDIGRFKSLPYERNRPFYDKIFREEEIDYCLAKAKPYLHFAGKFCAKETVIKALGDKKIFDAKNISILNNRNGLPEVFFEGKKINVFLSISHCDSHALAFCLAYK